MRSCLFPLPANDVDDRKNHNPDGIDEMPIHCERVYILRMLLPHCTQHGQKQNNKQAHQTHSDVERVQAHKRVVRRAKKIRGDGQPFVMDQVVPLPPSGN